MRKIKGYTLIEVLIVLAIIGIIAAIFAPAVHPTAGLHHAHRLCN